MKKSLVSSVATLFIFTLAALFVDAFVLPPPLHA